MQTVLKVIVAMNADMTGEVKADVRSLSSRERFMNGAKATGISWGLAVLSILVPVFHFVLVPAFLLVGLVMFFVQRKRTQLLEKARLTCPQCRHTWDLKNLNFNWPLRLSCPACEMVLLIEP